jgi:hypothetical protein
MKKIILFTTIALLILLNISFAQNPFWKSQEAYLGQKPPGDTPVVFAPGKLTDTGYWAGSRVVFTNDGKQFIYGTNTTWFDGKNQKLEYFKFDGKTWKGPLFLFDFFSNPVFSVDGKTLYLSGNDGAIYQTRFTDAGWATPIKFLKRSYSLYNFMPTKSGHYYVGSSGTWDPSGDYRNWKFSVLTGIGSDTSIQSLGEPLNSPGFNGDFFIAPDESYMIISTKETPTFECELYISFRKPDLLWTKPISMGALINDGVAHRWGANVSPDHEYLFYTKGTSEKDCKIYWVRFDNLLKKLRSESL